MGGESHFFFSGTPLTSYRVNIDPAGFLLRAIPKRKSGTVREREWYATFADVARVDIKELRGTQTRSESLTFHMRKGRSVRFGSVISNAITGGEDIHTYRQAAAAAMQALAEVRPDARIQHGQSIFARLYALFASLIVSLLFGFCAMWFGGGPGAWGYAAFGVVTAVFTWIFFARLAIGRKPTPMTVQTAADYLAARTREPV